MRKFKPPSDRPPRAPKPKGLGVPGGLLHWIASTVDEEPNIAEFFHEEKKVIAMATQWGDLVVTAAYENGWLYVRGENFEHDWYGSGRTLSAAIRDYLEHIEAEVDRYNKTRPRID